MKKLIRFLLYLVLGAAGLLAILGLFAKKTYHIERSIEIDAPRSVVFDYVRHLDNFDNWAAWQELDPEMEVSVSGTDGEVGASNSWKGNADIGEGSQTITAISPDRIDFDLELVRPLKSSSKSWITFEPNEQKTKVSWASDISIPFPMNGLAMFTDVDKGLGADWEEGLQNLKRITEDLAHPKYNGFEVLVEETFPGLSLYGLRQQTDTSSVDAVFEQAMTAVNAAFTSTGTTATGNPMGFFWTWENGQTDMAIGLPAAAGLSLPGVAEFKIPKGKAYIIDYEGTGALAGKAHLAMDAFMKANQLKPGAPVVEEYLQRPPKDSAHLPMKMRLIYFGMPE